MYSMVQLIMLLYMHMCYRINKELMYIVMVFHLKIKLNHVDRQETTAH